MQTILYIKLVPELSALGMKAEPNPARAKIEMDYSARARIVVEALCRLLRLAAALGRLFSAPAWPCYRIRLRMAQRLCREIQKIAKSRRADKNEKCEQLYQQIVAAAVPIAIAVYDFMAEQEVTALASEAAQRRAAKLIDELEYGLLVILLCGLTNQISVSPNGSRPS